MGRSASARFSGTSSPGRHSRRIGEALHVNDSAVRLQILETMQRHGPRVREAVPTIIELLDDSDWRVRLEAIETLNSIGYPAPALKEALLDEHWEVREAAEDALLVLEAKLPISRRVDLLLRHNRREKFRPGPAVSGARLDVGTLPPLPVSGRTISWTELADQADAITAYGRRSDPAGISHARRERSRDSSRMIPPALAVKRMTALWTR
jgi:HEAT repeat protein